MCIAFTYIHFHVKTEKESWLRSALWESMCRTYGYIRTTLWPQLKNRFVWILDFTNDRNFCLKSMFKIPITGRFLIPGIATQCSAEGWWKEASWWNMGGHAIVIPVWWWLTFQHNLKLMSSYCSNDLAFTPELLPSATGSWVMTGNPIKKTSVNVLRRIMASLQ